MKRLLLLLTCLLVNLTFISYSQTTNEVYYTFGTAKIDKQCLIRNLRGNVASYLDYRISHSGWSSDEAGDFRSTHDLFMQAFDNPADPNRFYSDEFGRLIDTKGIFGDATMCNWYDQNGNKLTQYQYNSLSPHKKKKVHQFAAFRNYLDFFNRVVKKMINQQQEELRNQYPLDF